MNELLKKLGYEPEQIKTILEEMQNQKMYITTEENADIRLKKINEDFLSKDAELVKANELIKQLQEGNKENEDLQSKIQVYENQIEENKKEKIDNALKFELLKNKVNAEDIDYLIYKLKEKNPEKGFEIDENGNLKNFDVSEVKKEYQKFFEDETQVLVDVKKLGGSTLGEEVHEPESLLDALKDKYLKETDI